MSYTTRSLIFTCRELFWSDGRARWRSYKSQFLLDLAVCVAAVVLFFAWSPERAFWLWVVPFAITHVTNGYFAWLTHAPARRAPCEGNGSLNHVNNLMGLVVHNQGYHSVHHRLPGIHWTEIPDHLDLMEDLEPEIIVPYWATLNTAWRIVAPTHFRDEDFGKRWQERYRRRRANGGARLTWLPAFVWV
jgi:fatty acid desaturase